MPVADVGEVDAHAVADGLHVRQLRAVRREHRIHQQDVRAELDQADRQVATNEPQPAGDEHPPAGVEATHRWRLRA